MNFHLQNRKKDKKITTRDFFVFFAILPAIMTLLTLDITECRFNSFWKQQRIFLHL